MTAQESCIGRVTQLDWAGLRALWGQIQSRETPGWEQGEAFEYLVLRAFQIDGASVSWPYTVWHGRQAIEQVDGAIASDGLWCLVESKDTQDRVNVEPLAKLRNQLSRRPSPTIGLLFSVSGFTEPAQILANFVAPQTILLWDGPEVEYALQREQARAPLLRKYQVCVEQGRADHNLLEEAP